MNIVLFDGVCNFCNFWVNFLLKQDTAGYIKFASLQSDYGQEFLKKHSMSSESFDSFVFISEEGFYLKSRAAFEVAALLPYPYRILKYLKILPVYFTDACYSLIADNRYKLFGKKDSCMIPTKEQRQRFM